MVIFCFDVFPSETEYLTVVHLQEGFKTNPSHLIGPLKRRQGLELRVIQSCRENRSYRGLFAPHTPPSPDVRSGGGEMNLLDLSHTVLEMKTKILFTDIQTCISSYLSPHRSVSCYDPQTACFYG